MEKHVDISMYDKLTYRIFVRTLKRVTKYDDHTAERCYLSSNEHLSEYMKDMDLTNKKVATVGSSGDQFFQSLLQGSRDITIIDANPYTKVFVEYKRALLMNCSDCIELNRLLQGNKIFHWSTYAKISHDLSPHAKRFWDTLMLEQEDVNDYNKFNQFQIVEQLLHSDTYLMCNFYYDKDCYNRLQNILRNEDYKLRFKTADIFDFPKVLKEKYNLIMLSNIFGYHSIGEDKSKFEEAINKLYRKNLNAGGSIQVQYSFREHSPLLDVEEIGGHNLRIVRVGDNSKPGTVYFIDKPIENELLL